MRSRWLQEEAFVAQCLGAQWQEAHLYRFGRGGRDRDLFKITCFGGIKIDAKIYDDFERFPFKSALFWVGVL